MYNKKCGVEKDGTKYAEAGISKVKAISSDDNWTGSLSRTCYTFLRNG